MEEKQTYEYFVSVTQIYRVKSEKKLSGIDIRNDLKYQDEYLWIGCGTKLDSKEVP